MFVTFLSEWNWTEHTVIIFFHFEKSSTFKLSPPPPHSWPQCPFPWPWHTCSQAWRSLCWSCHCTAPSLTVTAATVRLWHADADDSDNTCQGTCPQGDSHSQTEGNSHSYGQYLLCCFTFILLFELPTLEWEGLMTQALLWRDQLLVNRSSLLLMSSLILFLIISSQTTSSPPPPSSLLPHTLPPAWTPQAWWWWPPCCSHHRCWTRIIPGNS